jgi:hypothetical protein
VKREAIHIVGRRLGTTHGVAHSMLVVGILFMLLGWVVQH